MKFRLGGLLSFLLLVGAAYGLYLVKWEVRELKRENILLEAEIIAEERALKVLEAEWAYLNRPERLRDLAQEHLKLELSRGEQIIETLDPAIIAQATAEKDEILQRAGYRTKGGH